MLCGSYCTGEFYNLSLISDFFTKLNWVHKIYSKEVLHIEAEFFDVDQKGDVFIFSYGCIIFWGLDSSMEEKILNKVKEFLTTPLLEFVADRCNYIINSEHETCVDEENDTIIIENDDPHIKLSFSYGLSQSVKLSVFEASVEKTIDENKKIPNDLIKTGKISLSRKSLAKKIGVLFVERNFINLNSDILDTPDFFWRRPKYDVYYDMAINFMDIKQRINLLNNRLAIIHELYEILSAELQHIHSSRLELIIIYLIMIEVILGLVRDFWRIVL